ncbi:hypothetical protein F4778DRAFT_118534 [Xylariomycetidae sp. FL2044]|nr:hypothetical protein F4778DRAFT_118534 [Xylariomycetidae sp. FL2044]
MAFKMVRFIWAFGLLITPTVALPPTSPIAGSLRTREAGELKQPVYQSLPLGAIKPRGWLKDQLEQEAAGLAGHLFDFYRYVHDSAWLGGDSEYSTLHESAPYWFNGLVPLAFGLDDDRLKNQVNDFVDYILDHQQEDGWIGPETTPETRGLWGRCYILLGLMQYAQADASSTDRIVDAMHRYVQLIHPMLQDNFTGLIPTEGDVFDTDGWGATRAHEMHIPLQWLYENYPRNNTEIIWDTMDLMIQGATLWEVDWRDFWVPGVYPEVVYAPQQQEYKWLFTHAVNMAEGLRFPLAIYRMSHDEALRTQTRTALDLLEQWHKSLAGTIIGDELITDLNPSHGAELCTAAEMMFSTAWIYQYLADNDIADWTELTAFNAFPASLSADWWSHQYVQQENQPWSRPLDDPVMWTNVDSQGNVFGMEPNYPCCTVNHPQAYPKFLANSFVKTEDGLAHVLLSPGHVSTSLGDNKVSIEAETAYPFGLSLSYSITADSDFAFYVRIPSWANPSSTVTSGGGGVDASEISPSDKGLQKFDISAGSSHVTINLETQPRVVTRANNTAAVYYGALLYSLAIDSNVTQVAPLSYTGDPLPANETRPETHDHIVEPTSIWNIAIDPSQIRVVTNAVVGNTTAAAAARQSPSAGGDEEEEEEEAAAPLLLLPNPIWAPGAPPTELRVAAVEIDWPIRFDTPEDPPLEPQVRGEPFAARFVPFGSAKVHMAHLPALELAEVDLLGGSG